MNGGVTWINCHGFYLASLLGSCSFVSLSPLRSRGSRKPLKTIKNLWREGIKKSHHMSDDFPDAYFFGAGGGGGGGILSGGGGIAPLWESGLGDGGGGGVGLGVVGIKFISFRNSAI